MGNIFTWGLQVGRISRIRIKISWMLLLFWFNELSNALSAWSPESGIASAEGLRAFGAWALGVGVIFGIILLHEFGHCWGARKVGGDADEVILWPLGGLASVRVQDHWYPHLYTAAAGPAVNLAIALIAYPTRWLGLWGELGGTWWLYYLQWILCEFNLFLLIFNLIPLYPLDGGRIFHALCWRHQERKGGIGMGPYYRATMATVWASRITAGLVIVYAIATQRMTMTFVAMWAIVTTEQMRMRLQAGVGVPETTYGHDFSQGYTSIDRGRPQGAKTPPKPGFFAKRKAARERKKQELKASEAQRLDEILSKISTEGMGNLTAKELRFLEEASKKRHLDDPEA